MERNLLLSVLVVFSAFAQGQRIAQAEWFTGNDPGEGLGTAMQVADGAWDEALEDVIATLPSTAPGDAVLSVRVKGANGYWSSTFRNVVHTGAAITARQIRVQQGEYFWDNDPGQGSAIVLLALDGNFNSALEQSIASDNTITPGAHRLFVRVRGADNGWSALFTQVVQVSTPLNARSIAVQQGEFFFDSNPGEGNGTPLLAFDGNWNAAFETGIASVSAPAVGDHLLYVRMRSADGIWSNEYKTVLHVSPSLPLRAVAVEAGEFFFDNDPGEGNATAMLAFDGNFDNALEQAVTASGFSDQGDHVLGVRVRGADNNWSAVFRSVIHIGPALTARDVRVQQGEFFFDNNPGEGNGTPLLAFDGNWNSALETGTASAAAPAVGDHLLYVRMRSADGIWSNEYKTVLHVSAPVTTRPVAVLSGEYYWDTDPGTGNGIAISAADGGFDEALEEAVSAVANNLTAGPHLLGVRVQGSDGGWSAAFRQVVSVSPVASQSLPIALNAFLQGPLQSATVMTDALRSAGIVPLTEPFTALGFAHMSSGGETINASVLAPSAVENVTDWIFVELRDANNPSVVLQTRCGLITDHGRIVSTDGFSNIAFSKPPGNYHVAVKHRNHLGVMTQTPLALGTNGAALDLRLTSTPTYGTNARATAFGRAALWSGDVNSNGAIKYTGSGNDRDPILVTVGSTTPNNVVSTYSTRDVNMNGQVKYTGSGNDRDPVLVNVGSTTPNNVRSAQLP